MPHAVYVTLRFDDGTEISARPLIYRRLGREALSLDLYTDDSVRVRCVDEKLGHYLLGDTGRVLTVSPR